MVSSIKIINCYYIDSSMMLNGHNQQMVDNSWSLNAHCWPEWSPTSTKQFFNDFPWLLPCFQQVFAKVSMVFPRFAISFWQGTGGPQVHRSTRSPSASSSAWRQSPWCVGWPHCGSWAASTLVPDRLDKLWLKDLLWIRSWTSSGSWCLRIRIFQKLKDQLEFLLSNYVYILWIGFGWSVEMKRLLFGRWYLILDLLIYNIKVIFPGRILPTKWLLEIKGYNQLPHPANPPSNDWNQQHHTWCSSNQSTCRQVEAHHFHHWVSIILADIFPVTLSSIQQGTKMHHKSRDVWQECCWGHVHSNLNVLSWQLSARSSAIWLKIQTM